MSKWPMVKLGELAEIVMGQAPKGKDINPDGNGVPVVAGASEFSETSIATDKWTTVPTKFCREGDILMSIRATIGPYRIADREYCIGRGIAAIRPRENVDKDFLVETIQFQLPELMKSARGATFLQVSKDHLQNLPIPLPPIVEQRRIADTLGMLASFVRMSEDELCALDQMLRSPLTNMIDVPETDLSAYVKAISSGKSLKESDNDSTPNRVLKVSAVTSGYFKAAESKPLPAEYAPPAAHLVGREDLIVCRANGNPDLIGAAALVEDAPDDLYLPDKLWKIHTRPTCDKYFLWHLLQLKVVRTRISRRSTGSGVRNIPQKSFLSVPVPNISPKEQARVGTLIRKALETRAALLRRHQLLLELQKAITTSIFNG